ncbi:hypothetical protein MTR67_035436 [Solanum verrucosum]|uniref:Acyltransferase C-terminal domain-containing protein n=1 Tax=Solanum verrucosum TaxID=315347 RepID=A0AAF0UAC1_SOLVR|nr:hypothetical protein MTR67_035436 [Solanum verrucosum]
MCDVGVPMHANGKRGVRHILLVKWSGGSLYLSRVSDIVDVFDEMSKAGVEPNEVHVYLKQHEMKDLPENDDAIAQWCRDIYVAKGVAISAALMTVTVLMQILINFSKSERSTAAQGCIWKDKEYESGF